LIVTSAEVREVRRIGPEFDLRRGLLAPPTLPWVPVHVDSAEAREAIVREAPADAHEVVVWMHYAAADAAVFEGACEEYNRIGSELLSGSGDPYIPGVRVGDMRGVSQRGSVVRSRGYGQVSTPVGTYRVPVGRKLTIATGNFLGWAALPHVGSVQWVLTLLQWRSLARAPVTQRVRFPSSHGRVAPQFFYVSTRVPSPVCLMRIGLTSNRAQRMELRGRDPANYGSVLFSDRFDVEGGESEVVYYVAGFPAAPSFVLELQPEDGTSSVLDYLETVP